MVIWGWWILNKTISRYPGESKISLQQIHCIQRIVHRQNTIERSGRKSHKTHTVESRTVQLSLSPALVRDQALVITFFRLKRPHRDRDRMHRRVAVWRSKLKTISIGRCDSERMRRGHVNGSDRFGPWM